MNALESIRTDARVTVRRDGQPDPDGRCVVYWMQRAQRGTDNPAFDTAISVANELRQPLAVFFGLHPGYPNSNLRHYAFLMDALAETAATIEKRGAAFIFSPYPNHNLIAFCEKVRASIVIGDENPMREPESWRRSAAQKLRVPFWTVDADVIVPTKLFAKEEYAARTLRPKIQKLLPTFLNLPRELSANTQWNQADRPASEAIEATLLQRLPLNRSVEPVEGYIGGTAEAMRRLNRFTSERLSRYDTDRNQPHLTGTSELSAHLHFGHISPLTIALAIERSDGPRAAKDAFLEEMIVRRELAINFVARNPQYDRLECGAAWALKTLDEERRTERPYTYAEAQLENAQTHDELWNAAQMEMVISGRMHGYLRMYWAKKILEWTKSPEQAFEIAVRLNDKYEMDGRDPNGYTGVAWAIVGKHDRPWAPKRPVFGMIRYMAASGCARKFDVKAYIRRVHSLNVSGHRGLFD